MSVEKQEVTQKTVGYSFHISIETEKRVDSGTKYPDKTVAKASLAGHAETYEDAVASLKKATEAVREQLREAEK